MKIKYITTSAILAFATSVLAQDKVDPAEATPTGAKAKQESKKHPLDSTFNIVVEVISLPMKEAAELVRSGKTDDQMYKILLENGKQQDLVVIRGGSGRRATSQSVNEMTYPTKYWQAEIPNKLNIHIHSEKFDKAKMSEEAAKLDIAQLEQISQTVNLDLLKEVTSPAAPVAFETSKVGFTVQTELDYYKGGKFVNLHINSRFVSYLGDSIAGQGISEMKMPRFGVQSFRTNATMTIGRPHLLGTLNRSPLSKVVSDSGRRVWFSFVTVKSVKSK